MEEGPLFFLWLCYGDERTELLPPFFHPPGAPLHIGPSSLMDFSMFMLAFWHGLLYSSLPVSIFGLPGWRNGRRMGLKILWYYYRAGSTPAPGTIFFKRITVKLRYRDSPQVFCVSSVCSCFFYALIGICRTVPYRPRTRQLHGRSLAYRSFFCSASIRTLSA